MSAPKDVARQLPVRWGRAAPPREPVGNWRDTVCRAMPKGWPKEDRKPRHASETEVLAEARTAAFISGASICVSPCDKRPDHCATARCRTMLCPMAVDRLKRRRMERKECRRQCFASRKAARRVGEMRLPELLNDPAMARSNLRRRRKCAKPREASPTKAGTTGPIQPERRGR